MNELSPRKSLQECREAHAARRGSLVDLIGNEDGNFSPPSAAVGDQEIALLLDRMIKDSERERDTQKEASWRIEQIIEDNERDAAQAAERIRVHCDSCFVLVPRPSPDRKSVV